MNAEVLLVPLGLVVLTTGSGGAWTRRVAVAAAGRRAAAAGVAAAEAVLFALVFGTVVSSLDDPVRLGGYAVGVAVGTWLGILAEERFSTGQSMVRLVVDGTGAAEVAALRGRGWPVVSSRADGGRGSVAVISVAVDDTALSRMQADVADVAPGAFGTTQRLREVRPVPFPTPMHRVARRRTERGSVA